jgi:hypothetical protein
MTMLKFILPALLSLALLCACTKTPSGQWERRIEPDLDSQTIVDDAEVFRKDPQVYIAPEDPPDRVGSALLLPMEVRQQVDHPRKLGRELGRIIALTWSKKNVFPKTFYVPESAWRGPEQSVALAEERGAQFIVRPILHHLLLGGSHGATSMAISIEVYSNPGGQLLWSMAHAGHMDSPPDRDYILFARKVRMPAAPEYVVLTALADELGEPIQQWITSAQP